MTHEDRIGRLAGALTEEERRAFADEFSRALTLELVCGDGLPADYRREIMRNELATLDNAAAEEFFERVMGRLDHDDPLVALMMGG
jgi:hypothetical protein